MSTGLNLWVWVDRARVIRRVAGAIVEGEPVLAESYGDWFACRLPPRSSRQAWGQRHQSLEDRRQMSCMVTPASNLLTEADSIEIEQDGVTSTWEVEQVFRPRNGGGDVLLMVCDVVRREES